MIQFNYLNSRYLIHRTNDPYNVWQTLSYKLKKIIDESSNASLVDKNHTLFLWLDDLDSKFKDSFIGVEYLGTSPIEDTSSIQSIDFVTRRGWRKELEINYSCSINDLLRELEKASYEIKNIQESSNLVALNWNINEKNELKCFVDYFERGFELFELASIGQSV